MQLESDRTGTDANWVSFERRSVKNNFQSEKQGHPVFYDVDYIIIQPPGNQTLRIETPVTQEHKDRYPRLWAAYQNTMAGREALNGTPVTEWPIVTRAQAETLKGLKFYTVEQVAGAPDVAAQALQMVGPGLREKAQAYLKVAKDSASILVQEAEKKKLAEENEALKAQMAKLSEQVEALIQAASEKPKRGRPRKVKEEEQKAA